MTVRLADKIGMKILKTLSDFGIDDELTNNYQCLSVQELYHC